MHQLAIIQELGNRNTEQHCTVTGLVGRLCAYGVSCSLLCGHLPRPICLNAPFQTQLNHREVPPAPAYVMGKALIHIAELMWSLWCAISRLYHSLPRTFPSTHKLCPKLLTQHRARLQGTEVQSQDEGACFTLPGCFLQVQTFHR